MGTSLSESEDSSEGPRGHNEGLARPLVSVVIAAYNATEWIEQAVRSCVAQTYEEIEVVVVDDASIDGTADIVEGMSDPRIRLVRLAENLGPGPARDLGIAESRGEWIAILDADDAMHPDRIRCLVQTALSQGWVTVVVDRILAFQGSELPLTEDARCQAEAESIDVIDSFIRHTGGGVPFFSRSLWLQSAAIHPPTRFGEDSAFLVQLLNPPGASLVLLDAPLYLYRRLVGSLTTRPDRRELDRSLEFLLNRPDLRPEYRAGVEAARRRVRHEIAYDQVVDLVRDRGWFKALLWIAQDPRCLWSVVRVRIRWASRNVRGA